MRHEVTNSFTDFATDIVFMYMYMYVYLNYTYKNRFSFWIFVPISAHARTYSSCCLFWFTSVMASSTSTGRFASVSEEERNKRLESAVPKSTKVATKFWLKVFSDFLMQESLSCDFATVEDKVLAEILERFYCSVRTHDKKEYKTGQSNSCKRSLAERSQ